MGTMTVRDYRTSASFLLIFLTLPKLFTHRPKIATYPVQHPTAQADRT